MKDRTTPELSPIADAFATSPLARQEKGQEKVPRLLQVRPILDAITDFSAYLLPVIFKTRDYPGSYKLS